MSILKNMTKEGILRSGVLKDTSEGGLAANAFTWGDGTAVTWGDGTQVTSSGE